MTDKPTKNAETQAAKLESFAHLTRGDLVRALRKVKKENQRLKASNEWLREQLHDLRDLVGDFNE